MESVYLGLLSSLFNAIYSAIIKPILTLLTNILETVFKWIFEVILKPLLINFLIPVLKGFAEIIFEMLAGVIYEIYVLILKVMDTSQAIFNIFAGIDDVVYKGESMTVLELFFRMGPIQKAAWIMISISVVLLLAASIVGVIKSIGELGEQQRPVSKVLHSTWQGFLRLITIPIVCLFLIQLSTVLLRSVNSALIYAQADDTGKQTTVARTLFVMSTLDAAKDKKYNVSSPNHIDGIGINDDLRSKYYYIGNNSVSYADSSKVKGDFVYSKINYILGFGVGLLLLYVLVMSVFKFINRVYNILILFILSPFFAASQPIDDGEKFKAWQDLFIGQIFSAYGTVISMQVYLMIIPSILDGKIGFGLSTEGDYFVKAIFLCGAAFAVKNAGPMITGFIDSTSASMEMQQDMAFFSGLSGAYGWGRVAYAGLGRMFSSDKNAAGQGGAGALGAGGEGGSGAGGKAGAGGKNGAKKGKSITGKDIRQAAKTGAKKKAALAAGKKNPPKPLAQSKFFGGLITRTKGKDGKMHTGVNLGKYCRFGMNADGTYKSNFFGFGRTYDAAGNLTKKSMPFVRMTKGADGNFHVSAVKISSGLQFRKAETVKYDGDGNEVSRTQGGWYCSEFSPLSYSASFDQATGKVEQASGFFTKYQRNELEDGTVTYTRASSWDLLGRKYTYEADEKGKEHVKEIDGLFFKDTYAVDEKTGADVLVHQSGLGGMYEYSNQGAANTADGNNPNDILNNLINENVLNENNNDVVNNNIVNNNIVNENNNDNPAPVQNNNIVNNDAANNDAANNDPVNNDAAGNNAANNGNNNG